MASGIIIHPGIIERIEGEKVSVRILAKSACSSCHAKGMCNISEVEEKIIEADLESGSKWHIGDEVMVRMEEAMGRKAVILGYALPLVVLVGSVILFLALLHHEGLAALLAIAMLVPYYGILYIFRKKLQKEFRFRIQV